MEQAKGALCQQEGVHPSTAFALLVARAEVAGVPLTAAARHVLTEAEHGRRWTAV